MFRDDGLNNIYVYIYMPILETALLGFIEFCVDPTKIMENGLNTTIQKIKKTTIPNHLQIEDAFTALNSMANSDNSCDIYKFIEKGQELINTLRELIKNYTINNKPYLARLTEIETVLNNRTNPNNVINEKKLVKMYLMRNNDKKYYEIAENGEQNEKDYGKDFYYIIENGSITDVGNLTGITVKQYYTGRNNITFKFKNGEKIMEYTIDDVCMQKLRVYKIRQDISLTLQVQGGRRTRRRKTRRPKRSRRRTNRKARKSHRRR